MLYKWVPPPFFSCLFCKTASELGIIIPTFWIRIIKCIKLEKKQPSIETLVSLMSRLCCYLWPIYLCVCERSIQVCAPGLGTMKKKKKDTRKSHCENQQPRGVTRPSRSRAHRLHHSSLALLVSPYRIDPDTKTDWREGAVCQCLGHIWTNQEPWRVSEQRGVGMGWGLRFKADPFEGKFFPTRDHYLVDPDRPKEWTLHFWTHNTGSWRWCLHHGDPEFLRPTPWGWCPQ